MTIQPPASDQLVTSDQFKNLFIQNTPFIDVRAEVEFAEGKIPGSANFPILNTDERHLVGTCYKQKGSEEAVKLGHSLVYGEIKKNRVQAWCDFAATNPGTHIFCWRGGMRSGLSRQWMAESGTEIPLIEGGFKALRRYLIQATVDIGEATPLYRIGGKTGTAKTPLIEALASGVDLEAHANHRGSSFGGHAEIPATQVNFEHALAIDLIRTRHNEPGRPLFLEDESRRIGPSSIPLEFFESMKHSPVAIVEMPLEFRIERVLKEYVIDMVKEFETLSSEEEAGGLYRDYLTGSLSRIQKRLGLEKFKRAEIMMENAISEQRQSGSVKSHEGWISLLLTDYYDPMYNYQLEKSENQVAFQGNYQEVLEWAKSQRI